MAHDDLSNPPVTTSLPAKNVPLPKGVSEQARNFLSLVRVIGAQFPALDDVEGWRAHIKDNAENSPRAQIIRGMAQMLEARVQVTQLGDVPAYLTVPEGDNLLDARQVVLDFHGGALIYGGGVEQGRFYSHGTAVRTGRATYSVDYRMPPDHPYPAAVDDAVAAYRALLELKPANDIVLFGTSAGGNLASALLLRAKDEGLPMPAGVVLFTPEIDMTESGDTQQTLAGLDILPLLMPVNLLYANGEDLTNPYISPLFGDVTGFPPTFLQSGTRDTFLSNTVKFHRKLRKAGVRAELHVWEAMTHAGFPGSPEDAELNDEIRAFLASL